MSELPTDWALVAFSAVAELVRGVSYKKNEADINPKEGLIPILRANNIQNGNLVLHDLVYVPTDKVKETQLIKQGDIIVAMSSGSKKLVGKSGVCDKRITASFGTFCGLIRAKSNCYPRYLGWFTQSKYYTDTISNLSKGVNINNLKPAHFEELQIPLPTLAEQKRIADKLDSVLAKVEAAQARLDKIPAILKHFRQSVLAAATSGELTNDWREENDADLEWKRVQVSEIVEKIEAGKSIKCDERPPQKDEFGIIKISAVTWGVYNELESKTLFDKSVFLENRRINVGDFLISRANTIELLGMPVIVHEVTKNLMLSDKVLRLVMDDIDKSWLSIYFRSPEGRKQIENGSSGNQESMRNIGQKALMAIELKNPTKPEKLEIIRRVDELFSKADSVEQQYNAAKACLDKLTQSILKKAFKGELLSSSIDSEVVKALDGDLAMQY